MSVAEQLGQSLSGQHAGVKPVTYVVCLSSPLDTAPETSLGLSSQNI